MNLFDMPKPYREAIAVWEGFRRLGFSPDEIYFASNDLGQVWMELRSQGKRFVAEVGRDVSGTQDEIERPWKELCRAINEDEVPEEDLQKNWKDSTVAKDLFGFVSAIKLKGFEFPYTMN